MLSVLVPLFLCSMCVVRTAHVCCCLPGQDRQTTLDDDDLAYDMEEEEDDYDEVPEMDSLEQPTVDGELPCTHLELRAKLLGETMELSWVLLGWCLHISWAVGPCAICLGGFGVSYPLAGTWGGGRGCTFSITVLPTPCRPCALSPLLKPSPAVMGAVLGWWDLLPWQVFCALVMSHRTDPKGSRRSGKPQWQQPLESPCIILSRDAVAIMSPTLCWDLSQETEWSLLPSIPALGQSTEISSSQTLPMLSLLLLGFPSCAWWVWQLLPALTAGFAHS